MTHSAWRKVPQFSSHACRSPAAWLLYISRCWSDLDVSEKATRLQQQWLLLSTPITGPLRWTTLLPTASSLPVIQPVKAEASSALLKAFPLRNYGMSKDAAQLCFVTFFCVCVHVCVKSLADLTHSLRDLLGETCPVVKGRKAQLTSTL